MMDHKLKCLSWPENGRGGCFEKEDPLREDHRLRGLLICAIRQEGKCGECAQSLDPEKLTSTMLHRRLAAVPS